MTRDEATAFAEEWIRTWNARDLDAIIAHYSEDAQFRSPKAAALVGVPTLMGKAALQAYWRTALERITSLHFILDHILWDAERSELLIVYIAALNDQRYRACELFRFDATGHVVEGEAMYGITG